MRRANTFATKTNRWELMNTNLKPHLADMPFLEPIAAELETVIADAKVLDKDQEVARKQLSDLIHRRQDVEKRGEQLRARLSAHLKGSFGYTSDQLIQFGVTPRPRVTRRKKVVPPTEPVVQAK